MRLPRELEEAILARSPPPTRVKLPAGECPPIAEDASEKEFQGRVVAYARERGWLCYHTFDSRRSEGGFPDLVLVRDRVVWVELKADKGKVSLNQGKWLAALARAKQEWHVWKPADWNKVLEVLK